MKWINSLILASAVILLLACNLGTSAPTAVVPPSPTAVPTNTSQPCLESGDQLAINARLQGADAVAELCPGAVFELTGPVIISAPRQEIRTQGLPTDDSRATLRVVSPTLTTAVQMRDFDGAVLSNVIVDGNRLNLGPKDGDALIYAGGYSDGQVIRGNKIMDPRSWSALHLIQGHSFNQPCKNALVESNEIGPSGTSDEMKWADGISLACSDSTVSNNTITDATDGGIVVFGAPGSVVENNVIRAETRTLLGGINMVDYGPYDGNYRGTVVKDNVIDASGAVIRIGLGMGERVWGCEPSGMDNPLVGGTVTGNILRGEHMQYGFAASGVREWTVTGNIDEATHSGSPGVDCGGVYASRPAGFQYDPDRAEGTFQPEFTAAHLDLALWAIVSPRPGQ